MTAVVVALAAAVLVLAVLVAGLLRSHAEILRALHELGAGLELDRRDGAAGAGPQPLTLEPFAPTHPASAGSGSVRSASAGPAAGSASAGSGPVAAGHSDDQAPERIAGSTLADEEVALSLRGGDTLLAFLSSGCSTCQGFWQDFAAGAVEVPGDARLVVVAQSLADESESALRERAPAEIPLVLSSEAWAEFSVPGSPYFVYVDGGSGRVVGEGSAASWGQVVDLLSQARADDRSRRRSPRELGIAGDGQHRRDRDDAALLAAGIGPGDPSLWSGSAEPSPAQRAQA